MKMKKIKRNTPEISTASLPDIIFMLLFFFMTVTVLRSATAKMPIELPATEDATKIKHEASEYSIYIHQSEKDNSTMIQFNEYLVSMNQLDQLLKNIASPLMDFEKLKVPIYLRIDKNVKMELVYDIKLLLRKHGLRKINYIVRNAEI